MIDTVELDKISDKVTDISDKVADKVDLHKITPDFIEERRLPEASRQAGVLTPP